MSSVRVTDQIGEALKAIVGNWTTVTLVGGFLLYVVGYLALRFHLTALGVGTDLAVLDERYLFTGARFIVYLVSTVPSVVLLALIVAALVYLPYRALPTMLQERTAGWVRGLVTPWSQPTRLAVLGICFAVVMIQFFMRDCFELSNLLLRPNLPGSRLVGWLLRPDEGRIALFFTGLVAGCLVSGAVLLAVGGRPQVPRWLVGLLAFLVAVQWLLVAVNYGYLVLDNSLPRVVTLDGKEPLAPNVAAWLVWEGKDGMTYLLRTADGAHARKSLVTIGRAKVEKIEIVAYDPILPALFGPSAPP